MRICKSFMNRSKISLVILNYKTSIMSKYRVAKLINFHGMFYWLFNGTLMKWIERINTDFFISLKCLH